MSLPQNRSSRLRALAHSAAGFSSSAFSPVNRHPRFLVPPNKTPGRPRNPRANPSPSPTNRPQRPSRARWKRSKIGMPRHRRLGIAPDATLLKITGVKVKFEGVDPIFARTVKRGDEFPFRDERRQTALPGWGRYRFRSATSLYDAVRLVPHPRPGETKARRVQVGAGQRPGFEIRTGFSILPPRAFPSLVLYDAGIFRDRASPLRPLGELCG